MLKYYSSVYQGFPVEPAIVVNIVNDDKVLTCWRRSVLSLLLCQEQTC